MRSAYFAEDRGDLSRLLSLGRFVEIYNVNEKHAPPSRLLSLLLFDQLARCINTVIMAYVHHVENRIMPDTHRFVLRMILLAH